MRNKLYCKIKDEYDKFISKLKKETPEKILEKSYEKTLKENIVWSLAVCKIPSYQIKPLLSESKPLEYIYQKWLDGYGFDMEVLRDCIIESASDLAEELRREKAPENKDNRER